MSFYVRHLSYPIQFLELRGRYVCQVTQVKMATIFPTSDAALDRAHKQFGEAGLQHVEICTVGAQYKKRSIEARETERLL